MKTVVVYKSETGFTKKYAEWIAEDLSADIFEEKNITIDELVDYDTIIYGGGLYAGGINGIKFIINYLNLLKSKKVIIYATGATPFREETVNELRNKNFTLEQQNNVKFYYLRGGFDYNKLPVFQKFLMTLLKWKLESKKELTPDEKGMLASYKQMTDFTKRENIKELVRYANE